MTREELIRMALRDQRHTVLEEAMAPLEILPFDLLTAVADTRTMPSFRIEGFVMRDRAGTPWWIAVVEGNCVMAEGFLRDRGHTGAFAGAPAYCRTRIATEEEKASYLAA